MSLTNDDAKIILGMSARGDNKHDIAAWFGVNQARIKEVEDGAHGNLTAAAADKLFPKGAPGPKGRRLKAFVEKALGQMAAGNLDEAASTLEAGLTAFNKNEA